MTAPWTLAAALLVILALFGVCHRREGRAPRPSVDLWRVLAALALGFWVFALLRYTGFALWPLARPSSLQDYVILLVSHAILLAAVFASLLWLAAGRASFADLTWGDWRRAGPGAIWGLRLAVLGVWLWALHATLSTPPPVAGQRLAFLLVALSKAILTGVGEEVVHRGVVQPLAIVRFGVFVGIGVQSCIYTAFHLDLGAAFWSQPLFLLAVMALGLLFGGVTRLTGGIGWACAVHVAIALVVELRNLA